MTNKERLEANNRKLKSIEFLLEEKAQATPVTEPLTVSANGTYEPATGVDGLNSVEVDVQPTLETLAVTINGTYTPSANVDGYSSVSVNVPTAEDLDTELATQESSLTTLETEINALPEQTEPIEPVLATLNVTANGTYTPPTGTDGYNNVIVNVPNSESVIVIPYIPVFEYPDNENTIKTTIPVTSQEVLTSIDRFTFTINGSTDDNMVGDPMITSIDVIKTIDNIFGSFTYTYLQNNVIPAHTSDIRNVKTAEIIVERLEDTDNYNLILTMEFDGTRQVFSGLESSGFLILPINGVTFRNA